MVTSLGVMLKHWFFLTGILLVLVSLVNGYSFPWSWDTITLWTDFGVSNTTMYNNSLITDYQAEFLATHYNIISIEKCLGNPQKTNISTEQSFYKIASNIRQYANSNQTKILLYFNIPQCFCDCYDITNTFYNNQSMYFRDDNGNIIYANGYKYRPYYDHTQQYVRNWWVNAVTTIIKNSLNQNIIVDGLFGDGIAAHWNNPNISTNRSNEYNEGIILLLDELRTEFNKINNDLFVIGNDITMYSFAPNHNLNVMSHVDGMMGDHFGAYEEVINSEGGKINATDLLIWYNISKSIKNGDYGSNKALLMKGWIGPETQPITSFGPSWPTTYYIQTPTTHQQVQNVSSKLLLFPLSVYLCGIYYKNVYFTYTWFWNIDQGVVPCPDDPSSCDAPSNWYKEFMNKLGKPVSDGIMTDTYKCNRSFEYATVYVDLNDSTSALIQWL